MRSTLWVLACLILAILPESLCHAQSNLGLVLGSSAVTLDAAKVAQVKAGVQGTRFYYDTNNDGKMDECWFIDIDPRHTTSYKPLLVKVIDQDGDLATGKEPDRDSDLYIADWGANGIADVAIEYVDTDHDNDMDQMAMYYPSGSTIRCWWSRDDGDDNLLWWDNNYQYDQDPCQHFTHFGGDETFYNIEFNAGASRWDPVWEAPFFFIDNNHDGRSDEVIRVTVNNTNQVASLRWSFDVNADSTPDDPRNFDCSISAYPPNAGLTISGGVATSAMLHGYPITPMLDYGQSKTWLRSITWRSGLFTWVENDNNVGWAAGGAYPYTSERWEGVIANGNGNFGAIGGPTCGPFNNRNEMNLAPTGPFAYYYNPADKRIHLKNASQAWVQTDWDSNYYGDGQYNWTDTNADGLLDRITYDQDGNGTTDDQWDIATGSIQNLTFDFNAFHDAYAPVVRDYPAQLYDLDRALAAALESVQAGSSTDAVWTVIDNKFSNGIIPEWKRVKFLNSDIALIYYMELARDRRIIKLKSLAASNTAFWTSFNAARTAGNTTQMTSLLGSTFGPATPNWTPYATWLANLRANTNSRVGSSTAWSNGIAWETESSAWRILDGRFDFLGKRSNAGLVLSSLTASSNISTDTGAWGMDALVEGTGPGCGGLTLYVNGTAYPLYGSSISATYRVVDQAADKVTVEMTINNAGPSAAPRTVHVRAVALAGRSDTQVQATVTGGPQTDTVELGIGLVRPPENYYEHRAAQGVVGIWGVQNPQIEYVGLGLIYLPGQFSRIIESASEIDVLLNVNPGQYVVYTLKDEWRRGLRFSNYPVGPDFLNKLTNTVPTITLPPVSAAKREWSTIK